MHTVAQRPECLCTNEVRSIVHRERVPAQAARWLNKSVLCILCESMTRLDRKVTECAAAQAISALHTAQQAANAD